MGRSGSSSQANQATNTSSADSRIVNESGIVARDSAIDLSSYFNTSTTLNSVDSSDRSTSNSYADNSDKSVRNTYTDDSDRSTFLSSLSTTTDSRDMSSKSWDNSTKNTTSNAVTGSYNTTADPLIAKAAFDFASGNDARNGEGLDKLLDYAAELTNKTQDSATGMAARFQDGILQAFDSARTTTPGGIDNKTMIILGVAGAAAIGLAMANKRA